MLRYLRNVLIAFAFAAGAIFFCFLSRRLPEPIAPYEIRSECADFIAEKTAGSVRIASVNCKNYLTTNRYTSDGKYKRRWAKPLAEREAMWQAFAVVRPDVVALQEIGEEKHLDELTADLLRKYGLEFPYKVCLSGRDTHRRIGIISRIPFEQILRYPEPEKMSRGLLGVELLAGARSLYVFTLHLKSKISRSEDDPECARERLDEARCVGKILAEYTNEYCVLLGDFNDLPESPPVQSVARESAMKRVDLKDSRGESWTYRYLKMNEKRIFDHLFVSPKTERIKVPQSGKIADDDWAKKVLPDGQTVYASDHRMIFVDLLFPKESSEN